MKSSTENGDEQSIRLNQGQRAYVGSLQENRETVLWDLDPGRHIWAFEACDETPPLAPDWFFVLNHPRTGSSIASRLLSKHPAIYCGLDEQVLPLFMAVLGSRLFIAPRFSYAVRYHKRIKITPVAMRNLMDAWRRSVSNRPLFGDKGDTYYTHFGSACEQVFPFCKLLLTTRRPLDALSSFLQQPWAAYMFRIYQDDLSLYHALRSRSYLMLDLNKHWRGRSAEVIVFEELHHEEGFIMTFSRVFRHLGVDPDEYDWTTTWTQCRHGAAIDRWKSDPTISAYVAWLEREDPVLHSLLLEGAHFLPQGVSIPPDVIRGPIIEEGVRTAFAIRRSNQSAEGTNGDGSMSQQSPVTFPFMSEES